MTSTAPRAVRPAVDPSDGLRVVLVPLGNSGVVTTIEADDYALLLGAGLSRPWVLNSNGRGRSYVRTSLPGIVGNLVSPARAFLGIGPNVVVRYEDGDPTNLRRSNLNVQPGQARRQDRHCVELARRSRSAANGTLWAGR